MSNLDSARKALQAFSSGDVATTTSLMADDYQFLGVTPQPLGKEEFLGFMHAMKTAFPDFTFEEITATESGATVTIKHHITGTHTGPLNLPGMPPIPATGKSIRLSEEGSVFTFRGEKISQYQAETTPDGGLPGMLKQLGVQMPG